MRTNLSIENSDNITALQEKFQLLDDRHKELILIMVKTLLFSQKTFGKEVKNVL
jgi:hypothetical protein